MTPTRRTQAILLIVFVSLLGYEAWTLLNGVPGDTISAAMWDWGDKHPDFNIGLVIVFVLGIAHFVFRWRRAKTPE